MYPQSLHGRTLILSRKDCSTCTEGLAHGKKRPFALVLAVPALLNQNELIVHLYILFIDKT